MATILEREGNEVEIASCGYTAIAKIEANPPDIALLDVMLTELDDYQVAQWIRYNQPSVAVLLMTAASDGIGDRLFPFRIRGYISKPIDLQELLVRIEFFKIVSFPNSITEQFEKSVVY